jgi:hypothetical protein
MTAFGQYSSVLVRIHFEEADNINEVRARGRAKKYPVLHLWAKKRKALFQLSS